MAEGHAYSLCDAHAKRLPRGLGSNGVIGYYGALRADDGLYRPISARSPV